VRSLEDRPVITHRTYIEIHCPIGNIEGVEIFKVSGINVRYAVKISSPVAFIEPDSGKESTGIAELGIGKLSKM
jgi:hypothetical protein